MTLPRCWCRRLRGGSAAPGRGSRRGADKGTCRGPLRVSAGPARRWGSARGSGRPAGRAALPPGGLRSRRGAALRGVPPVRSGAGAGRGLPRGPASGSPRAGPSGRGRSGGGPEALGPRSPGSCPQQPAGFCCVGSAPAQASASRLCQCSQRTRFFRGHG